PFVRAFTCAAIFCCYAVPYAWMDEPGHMWPIIRTLVAAFLAAVLVGTMALRFAWPSRWWQFAVAFLLAQVLAACALELAARQLRRTYGPAPLIRVVNRFV